MPLLSLRRQKPHNELWSATPGRCPQLKKDTTSTHSLMHVPCSHNNNNNEWINYININIVAKEELLHVEIIAHMEETLILYNWVCSRCDLLWEKSGAWVYLSVFWVICSASQRAPSQTEAILAGHSLWWWLRLCRGREGREQLMVFELHLFNS